MNIVENTLINVYNYSDSVCVASSNIKPEGYLFEAANNNMPFSIPLTFSEIRVINSQSDIFRMEFYVLIKSLKKMFMRHWLLEIGKTFLLMKKLEI